MRKQKARDSWIEIKIFSLFSALMASSDDISSFISKNKPIWDRQNGKDRHNKHKMHIDTEHYKNTNYKLSQKKRISHYNVANFRLRKPAHLNAVMITYQTIIVCRVI